MSHNCIVNLLPLEGPLHPSGKNAYCSFCGNQYRIEPFEIAVAFGTPPGTQNQSTYAAYANHCAIQRKLPMTAASWERNGKPYAPPADAVAFGKPPEGEKDGK